MSKRRDIIDQEDLFVPVPFDAPQSLTGLQWRLDRLPQDSKLRVEADADRGLVFHVDNDRWRYLIHNGFRDEFQQLRPGSGLPVTSGSSLRLKCAISSDGVLSRILVLEFDEQGRRLGATKLPVNTSVDYKPAAGVARVLLTLMMSGSGHLVLRNFSVHPVTLVTLLRDTLSYWHRRTVTRASAVQGALSGWYRRRKNLRRKAAKKKPAPRGPHLNLTHQILSALAADVPVSDGSAYGATIPLNVAIVTDEFMYNFYQGAFAELHYLSPDNFEEILSSRRIDTFLYVTCWSGLRDEEWRGLRYRERPAAALREIIQHCRDNGIRTIFQSIEDPSNFDNFIEIAKMFDCVFTADADIIPQYIEQLDHDRVFYGEYGANPLLHNPIGCRRLPINGAFFAGSYPTRYAERCEDMETIFSSVHAAGAPLVIADRNFGSGEPQLQFPARWRRHVVPKFSHDILQSVHKLFRYNINLNSIKHSSTMCAMRVYELQAQGRRLISSYARSTYNRFPNVLMVPHRMKMEAFFRPEDREDYRWAMIGVREVMSSLTNVDVAGRMMARAGFSGVEIAPRTVAVIADQLTEAVRDRFAAQSYPAKVLLDAASVRDAAAWAEAKRQHRVDYFAFFSADDEYEAGYLSDLLNGFKYTASRYVAKASWFNGGRVEEGPQHDYTTCMPGRARTMFAASAFEPAEFLGLEPHQAIHLPGGYAVDPFELNYRRFLTTQREETRDPALSVVIPIFNNGEFLAAKCMPSLMRNQLWPRMEVILVDDGSTDPETRDICASLRQTYSNIRLFEFRDGGSGSASRPRNKGVELATAPLVSFLDPDNEISAGGYDTLHHIYEELAANGEGVPFVSGYQVKVGAKTRTTGSHTGQPIAVIEDLRASFFERGRFPVISTQAAVIDRSFLERTGLRFVEGAAGQDTLYGWELLAHAGRGAFTADAFLLYYAERTGSITNAISAKYFQKKLVLEKEQRQRLEALGLLDAYVQNHLEVFFWDWYAPRLKIVSPDEREQAEATLGSIMELYGRPDLMAELHRAPEVEALSPGSGPDGDLSRPG